jgi:phospholipid/cholesterol/gamma-HCH transport system permease protein
VNNFFDYLGRTLISFIEQVGEIGIFLFSIVKWLFKKPFFFHQLFKQMEFIGVKSSSVIVLTGVFTGMVTALQMNYGFRQFGAEALVGSTTTLSVTRELGPVLAALMVTARAGSAMTAEIGTMRVTEQIDAMTVMGVNPFQYLVIPRIIAGLLVMPMLTLVFDAVGMAGSWIVGVKILGINESMFWYRITQYVHYKDIFSGLFKAAFFGLIISSVGSYKGYSTTGGAEGVGTATTYSVVISSVSILVADYILTAFMY